MIIIVLTSSRIRSLGEYAIHETIQLAVCVGPFLSINRFPDFLIKY